jgi:putative transposase
VFRVAGCLVLLYAQPLSRITITWIERTYHQRRRQRALGKVTPVEYEALIGYNRPTAAA